MFNRDRVPGLPGSSPRPPQQRNDGYGRPQQPPPQRSPGYDTGMTGGYDERASKGYGQPPQRVPARGPPPGGMGGNAPARQLRPVKSPGGNAFAFGNIVAVSPQDFPPAPDGSDIYIILNANFVLSARPTSSCLPGEIGLTDAQRTWAGITLGPRELVEVQPYHAFNQSGGQSYLGSIDVEVGFAGRKTTDSPYDQDELAIQFTRNFENQIIAPGQQLLLDVKNIPLRLTIRSVQLADLAMEKDSFTPPVKDPAARGILVLHTQVIFFKDARTDIKLKASSKRPAANAIIRPDFNVENLGIGGLSKELGELFRRAFASRIQASTAKSLGIKHARGILLYGPPGTGKTLIARQIGQLLNARPPKVVNGPEVLNKYVGQSEENIRKLFADAEKEQKEKGDDSELHIIIFDELDAVCKQRGSSSGNTGVGDSIVNQLLSKLDGVDQLNNIILIGMTNRKDMIDDALLRPGRLEVHMEIPLPDEQGRAQILRIHTAEMRQNNMLAPSFNLEALAQMSKNYSGAELAGVVRAAASHMFDRNSDPAQPGKVIATNPDDLQLRQQDFILALGEVKAAFGSAEEDLERRYHRGIIHFSSSIEAILDEVRLYINQVRRRQSTPLHSMILLGPRGSGKTALAAYMASKSDFPLIKFITPENMIGLSERDKVQSLNKTFQDAYKSELSLIIIDNIELLVEFAPLGFRYNNAILIALKTLLEQEPPKDRRLLIIATGTQKSVLKDLGIFEYFMSPLEVPTVDTLSELRHLMLHSQQFSEDDLEQALRDLESSMGYTEIGVGVKKVLTIIETAKEDTDVAARFVSLMLQAIERARE